MKKLKWMLSITILIVLMLVVANVSPLIAGDDLATPQRVLINSNYGVYRYLFYYDQYTDYDNMWCVRGRRCFIRW